MVTRIRAGRPEADSRYMKLVGEFPLRPLKSDDELDRAIARLNALLDREDLDPGEEDYLDVLGTLVHAYEQEHHPIPDVSGAEMLRFLIESNGQTQAQVAESTGIAESTVSALLAGKRPLSRKHVEALARHFAVSPAAFLAAP